MTWSLISKTLLLLVLIAAVQVTMFVTPLAVPKSTYLLAWTPKHERLKASGQNRLILVGGSNIAFGVDSSRIESSVNMSTLNMGLQGGVGLQFMLNEAADGARAGDAIVLIPEYEHFYGNLLDGDLTLAELLHDNRSAWRYLSSVGLWLNMARHVPLLNSRAVFGRLDQVMEAARGRRGVETTVDAVYRRDAFDAKGDIVASLPPDRQKSIADTVRPLSGKLNNATFKSINRFGQNVEQQGIRFAIVYPVVAASFWAVNQGPVAEVARRLPARWTLSSPEDWVFDDKLFFDSYYHLRQEGREKRTNRLLAILSPSFLRGRSSG